MRLIRKSEYRVMPWKNGQGLTAEIDRSPETGSDYLWRLSQATIRVDGPFSAFPGYDRLLMVWKGEGLMLGNQLLEPLKPFRFSGDHAEECRLIGGEVLDVGLIFDRSRIHAEMKIVEGPIFVAAPKTMNYLFDLSSGDTLIPDHTVAIKTSLWLELRRQSDIV